MILSTLTAALALAASGVLAHPKSAEELNAHLETLRRISAHSKRSLAQCADSPDAIALRERAVARRAAWADELRVKRGLATRKSFPLFCFHFPALSTLSRVFCSTLHPLSCSPPPPPLLYHTFITLHDEKGQIEMRMGAVKGKSRHKKRTTRCKRTALTFVIRPGAP